MTRPVRPKPQFEQWGWFRQEYLRLISCATIRARLWGLAVAGEAGVAHVLEILRREIDQTMALMGVSRVADLTSELIIAPARGAILQGKNAKISNR